jgi:hypothetical protein
MRTADSGQRTREQMIELLRCDPVPGTRAIDVLVHGGA